MDNILRSRINVAVNAFFVTAFDTCIGAVDELPSDPRHDLTRSAP